MRIVKNRKTKVVHAATNDAVQTYCGEAISNEHFEVSEPSRILEDRALVTCEECAYVMTHYTTS